MLELAAIALLLLAPKIVLENVVLPIPGQGWGLHFRAPHIERSESGVTRAGLRYAANAGRMSISLFVERPAGPGRNAGDVYDYYWPQAVRNPLILRESVRMTGMKHFVRVTYEIPTTFEGRSVRQINANYYFAYRERWMDLHVSVIEPTEADMEMLAEFEKSLSYEAF